MDTTHVALQWQDDLEIDEMRWTFGATFRMEIQASEAPARQGYHVVRQPSPATWAPTPECGAAQ
jgi:hypothetical protein